MRDTDTANSVEAYKAELAAFFAGLDQKINGAVTDCEAELANFLPVLAR